MLNLYQRSLDIILANQAPSGAYIASPTFPTYHYCWYRDGAFTAYAMNRAGQHESAARFHEWASRVLLGRADRIQQAVSLAQSGSPLGAAEILHTRYTLDGEEAAGVEWPNFQLDGFGTWLWALGEHLRLSSQTPPARWLEAADLCAAYLAALWPQPCYDCWEEFPDQVHPHTLAAIYGGLQAYSQFRSSRFKQVLPEIKGFLAQNAVSYGHYVKFIGSHSVDSSLLGLAIPYQVVTVADPILQETVRRIERTLHLGGVRRYATDTYYGGGEWILLAAWLGWYYAENGQPEAARSLLSWIENQVDSDGCLPEQTSAHLVDPENFQNWHDAWGPVAKPLTWSHAMYVILHKCLAA